MPINHLPSAKVRTNKPKIAINKTAAIRVSCAVMILTIAAAVISASHTALSYEKSTSDMSLLSAAPSAPPQMSSAPSDGDQPAAVTATDLPADSEFPRGSDLPSDGETTLDGNTGTDDASELTDAKAKSDADGENQSAKADLTDPKLNAGAVPVSKAAPEHDETAAADKSDVSVKAAVTDAALPETDLIQAEFDKVAKVTLAAIPELEDTLAVAEPEEKPRHTVVIKAYNQDDIVCSTPSTTVGELLESLNITTPANTSPTTLDLSQEITEDTQIILSSLDTKIVEKEEFIPFETIYQNVETVPRGVESVEAEGTAGVRILEYTQKFVNGEMISETFNREYVATNPTNAVINKGIGGSFQSSDGTTYTYSHYIDVNSTTYTGGGITATGLPADESVISVDPNVIPLRSQVYVMGDYGDFGIRTAADVGGAVKGNKIDVYLEEDHPLFANFGRRNLRVYFID